MTSPRAGITIVLSPVAAVAAGAVPVGASLPFGEEFGACRLAALADEPERALA